MAPGESNTLSPTEWRWFSHQYNRSNEDRSHAFYVKFDSDVRVGRKFNIEYHLKRYAAIEQGCMRCAVFESFPEAGHDAETLPPTIRIEAI